MRREGEQAYDGGQERGSGEEPRAALSTPRTVALVARREFTSRVASKAFLISNALILVAIVASAIGFAVFSGDGSPARVGLVGGAQNLSAPLADAGARFDVELETIVMASEEQARADVTSGDVDVALVPQTGGGLVAVAESEVADDLAAVVQTAVNEVALDAALAAQDVDRAALDAALERGGVTVEILDPPDPESSERTVIAYIALLVLFFQIFVFGLYVATGVIEEKASRVVEVLLSTIRPVQLLAGKVIGIGAVGLLQLAAYGVVGLVSFVAVGIVTVTGTAVAVLGMSLLWFVLGFVFFGVLYAAGGSMVSRQEDVNSTTTPINVLAFAMFFAAQFTLGDPDGRVATVLSWIPPFSAALVPLRVASGDATAAQVVGSVVVMVVTTALLTVVAARIYQRTVLRSGSATTWTEVLRRR